MKVSVFKLPDGRIDIMVEASPGHGKSPVVLQNVTRANLVEALGPVLDAQRGRRASPDGDRLP